MSNILDTKLKLTFSWQRYLLDDGNGLVINDISNQNNKVQKHFSWLSASEPVCRGRCRCWWPRFAAGTESKFAQVWAFSCLVSSPPPHILSSSHRGHKVLDIQPLTWVNEFSVLVTMVSSHSPHVHTCKPADTHTHTEQTIDCNIRYRFVMSDFFYYIFFKQNIRGSRFKDSYMFLCDILFFLLLSSLLFFFFPSKQFDARRQVSRCSCCRGGFVIGGMQGLPFTSQRVNRL